MTSNVQASRARTLAVWSATIRGVFIVLLSGAVLTAADASVEDILKMIAAKLPDETILLQVRKAGKPINLSTDDLIKLKQVGASDQLVRALLQGDTAQTATPLALASTVQPEGDLKSSDDPEVLGVPYIIDPSGKFLELERQNVNAGTKVKAMGFGGGRTVERFEGSRSPVRFQRGSPMRFVLRTGGSAIADPSSLVNLERLTSAKDHREATTAKIGPMGIGGAKSTLGANDVLLKASQCGRSSLCFTAATPLMPGEYVITLGSKFGFLFGVD